MTPSQLKNKAHRELQFTETEWKVFVDLINERMLPEFKKHLESRLFEDVDTENYFKYKINLRREKIPMPLDKLRYGPNGARIKNYMNKVLNDNGWEITYNMFTRTCFSNTLYEVDFDFRYKALKKKFTFLQFLKKILCANLT